jgi:hypothetical protein
LAARLGILWGRSARRPGLDLAELTGDLASDYALVVEPGVTPAFRLNSDTGQRFAPERLAELPDRDAMLAALEEETARQLDLFAKHPRRFLDLYFAFVAARARAEKAALQERLAWSDGLFDHRDWVFSALRPLPRARLASVDGTRLKPLGGVVDFAFWTGNEAVTVEIGSARASQSSAEASPGVAPVRLAPGDLESVASCFSPSRFPEIFFTFWWGEAWPASPFRPRGLEAFLDSAAASR